MTEQPDQQRWTDFLRSEVDAAPPELREGQLNRAISAGRRRRARYLSAAGLAIGAVAAGTVIGVQSIGSSTPSTPPPVPTGNCHAVPTTDPDLAGKVRLDIAARGPVDQDKAPIRVRWSAPDKGIRIETGSPFEQAFLIDRRNRIVARIAAHMLVAGVGLTYDIAGHTSTAADQPDQPDFVGPFATCSGKSLADLPGGRYQLVVVAQVKMSRFGTGSGPDHLGDVASTPVSVTVP